MVRAAKTERSTKIADQIQRDLATLIPKEVSNPKAGMVTLTGCEITPDYAHATVYFTSIGSTEEDSTEALNKAAPLLHQRIFKLLHIHTVPKLHFVYDKSVEKGFLMDQLISRARKEDCEKIKSE